MRIIITGWGLDSYLEHRHSGLFGLAEYRSILRPDILLLHTLLTRSPHQKFRDSRFWGPAQDRRGMDIPNGFKMKWHNFGNGNVQFRLCVAIVGAEVFLCHAYVKTSRARDLLMAASLKDKISLIRAHALDVRGEL